jgi:glycosyltransferase involved in cell wall biosynthesis
MSAMRVAFIAHESTRGGAQLFLIDVIDFFHSKHIDVLAISPLPGPFTEALLQRGVECRYVKSPWWWTRNCKDGVPYRETIDAAKQMVDILEEWGANIVYTNTIVAPAGPFAAALTGLPHIWHIHEFAYNQEAIEMHIPKQELAALMMQTTNLIIFNSHSVAHEWDGFFNKTRTAVVYNWIDLGNHHEGEQLPGELPDLRGRSFFSHIAYVSRWKRQLDSLHALNKLVIEGYDIVLIFAGSIADQCYYQELCEYIHINNLDDNVRFIGHIDNPTSVLNQSVANLVCSQIESFGRVTIESMAAGVPVIGAASTGTAEIIQNELNGLLYPPGNIDALTHQMLRLLSDNELRDHLSNQGLERVKRFSSPETEMGPVLRLMQELLDERNPSWPLGYSLSFVSGAHDASSSVPESNLRNNHFKNMFHNLASELKPLLSQLTQRKTPLIYLYRDARLRIRISERCPPMIKMIYQRAVPWRIRNFLESHDKDLMVKIRRLVCPE